MKAQLGIKQPGLKSDCSFQQLGFGLKLSGLISPSVKWESRCCSAKRMVVRVKHMPGKSSLTGDNFIFIMMITMNVQHTQAQWLPGLFAPSHSPSASIRSRKGELRKGSLRAGTTVGCWLCGHGAAQPSLSWLMCRLPTARRHRQSPNLGFGTCSARPDMVIGMEWF